MAAAATVDGATTVDTVTTADTATLADTATAATTAEEGSTVALLVASMAEAAASTVAVVVASTVAAVVDTAEAADTGNRILVGGSVMSSERFDNGRQPALLAVSLLRSDVISC